MPRLPSILLTRAESRVELASAVVVRIVYSKLFRDLMVEQNLSSEEIFSPITDSAYEVIKRCADIVAAILLVILFAPILVVVSVWVLLDSRGPIFFRQERIGRFGKTFKIIKFRTMVTNAESLGPQVTSRNDPRVTRSGRTLRVWKLDELPQFFNVIIGDMSLVGPRPQVPKYVEKFPPRQRTKILSVRPGVTGPTAIKFRHEEEMLQNREDRELFYIAVLLPIKCNLDEEYVDSRGFRVDCDALFQTASMLVRGVLNRLRRIPVGTDIEYEIPELLSEKNPEAGHTHAAINVADHQTDTAVEGHVLARSSTE